MFFGPLPGALPVDLGICQNQRHDPCHLRAKIEPAKPLSTTSALSYVVILARLTVKEGLRAKLPWLVGALVLTGLGLAQFLTQVSIIEASEVRATVLGAFLRSAAVFITVLFVISSTAREAGDKFTDLLLSQAMPRWAYLIGKLSGFMVIAAALAVLLQIPLWMVAPDGAGIVPWTISLWWELAILSSLSLFLAMTFSQPAVAISGAAAFYILSRSMATLELIANASLESQSRSMADQVVAALVHAISLILPALDRFSLSSWLVQSPGLHEVMGLSMQAGAYVALLVAAGLFDLYRKNL